MSYPIAFEIVDVEPGKVPYVKASYLCEDTQDAMRCVHRVIATHNTGVDVAYDVVSRVLVLRIGEQYPKRDLLAWNSGSLLGEPLRS